jgi:hypothetical protein
MVDVTLRSKRKRTARSLASPLRREITEKDEQSFG